jgi:hypothetical protein
MGIKLANNAFATLAAGINSSVTSITVTSGQGARFPTLSAGDYFYATLIDTSNNLEIVKCTARSTDVLTVVRAQESTTARAYSTGDRIEIRITAQTFVDAAGTDKLPLAGGTLSGNLKVQVSGNAEISAQYGTGLEAKLGAYATETTLYLPTASTNFKARARTGASDTLALTALYSGTERDGLSMDSLGRVKMPLQPFFYGRCPSGATKAANWALISNYFSDVVVNRGSHYNTSTGNFTCPVAGEYAVSVGGMIQTGAATSDVRFGVAIAKNGTDYQIVGGQLSVGDTPAPISTVIVPCAANDTLNAALMYTPVAITFGGGGFYSWSMQVIFLG